MAVERTQRRLVAILAADVVGYSKMMGADEAGTLAALKEMRSGLFDPSVSKYSGRIVKTTGDGVLVEFGSAVEAMDCAMAIQTGLLGPEHILRLRIGVNVGDVVIDDGDIFGDGVNIAARLESIADPGSVAISGSVYEYLVSRIDGDFRDGGRCDLKNISRPIQVWHWAPAKTDTASRETAPPALPQKPSIAVLAFDNLSGDPEQDYFSDGIVEAITAALSRIRAFFVIARNSAFVFKGRSVKVQEIGRELGVAYVLEGSVQRFGSKVRITVQLIETSNAAHLWAEKYDGDIDEIFDLQDRITEQVAGALEPSIRLAEVARARRKRPQDMGAYDYTMRAMRHVWMLEKDQAAAALELLEQAIDIDPQYPLALALASWCWAQRSVYTWVSDIEEAKARALGLADRAASHSTDDPLILAVLGTVHTFARNYGAARVLLERAIVLDPNAAWALSRLGWLEVYADRPQPAREYFERSLRLSPLDPMNFNNYVGLASAFQVEGKDEESANLFIRALEERPNAHWIHRNLAPALLAAGREHEAHASYLTLMKEYPDISVKKFKDAMVFSPVVLERVASGLRALGVPED